MFQRSGSRVVQQPIGFRHHCSLDPDDLINYELCFPGAVTGSTEINCPHCGELLTVPVNDPMGEESYQCRQCTGAFDVDWGEGQIKYSVE